MKTYTTPTYGLDLTDEYNEGWLDSNDFIVTLKSHGVRLEKSTSAGTATLDLTNKIIYFSLSQIETARLGKGYVKVELTCKKSNLVGKSNTDEFYLDDAIRKELETVAASSAESVLDIKHRTVTTSSGEVRIIEPKMPKVKIEPYTPQTGGTNDHNLLINRDKTGQHPISAIDGLESALNAKYVKPASGIPKTDFASDVQTSLTKADEAYVKPTGGVAKTDLSSDVQASLNKADSALQPTALTPYRTASDQDGIDATKASVSDLTSHTGNASIHVSTAEKTAWNAKAEPGDITSSITTHNSATDAHDARFAAKQDVINDLSAIRSGASAGATALQPSALSPYRTSADQDAIDVTKASASDLTTHTSNNDIHVTTANKTAWSAKYDKPTSGIPKSDLTSDVQTSLGLADTALQTHQSLDDYRKSADQDTIDAGKQAKAVTKTATINVADWGTDRKVNVTIEGLKVDSDITQMALCNLTSPTSMKSIKPFFTCTTAGTLTVEWNGTKPTTAITVVVVMQEI